MVSLFYAMASATMLDLSGFDTENVTSMYRMFARTGSLTSLDLTSFFTSNTTSMNSMFSYDDDSNGDPTSLTGLDLSSFDFSNVTNFRAMFHEARLLNTLLMPSTVNTSNGVYFSYMFEEVESLNYVDLSQFNTSNAQDMEHMFYSAFNLEFDASHFSTSNVTDMSWMFNNADAILNLDLSGYDVSNVTDVHRMFYEADKVSYVNLMGWNISNITDSTDVFLSTPALGTTPNKNVACDQGGSEGTGTIFGENCISVPTQPTVSIGAPSVTVINSAGTASFTLTYDVVPSSLDATDITVAGDSADCGVLIIDASTLTPDVEVSGCSSDGSISISLAGGTSNISGRIDDGAGPSGAVTIDNTAPTVSIGTPSVTEASAATPVTFELTYEETPSGLVAADITVNGDNAGCSVGISDAATLTPDVTVSNCSAVGSITITLAGGRSSDAAGNADVGVGPSSSVSVNPDDDGDGLANPDDPFPNDASIAEPMITVWQTTTDNETITLPLKSGAIYNFTVDWGDFSSSTVTSWDDLDKTHTYATAGTYTVTISGRLDHWYFANTGDKDKLLEVADLGATGMKSLWNAFYGCSNLHSISGGDISNVTSMPSAFRETISLTNLDLSSWDTSKVTNFHSAFRRTGLQSIDFSLFSTSSALNMELVFTNSDSLTSLDLSNFDTSKVTNMSYLFADMDSLQSVNLSSFNTSNVTEFKQTFDFYDSANDSPSSLT